MLNILQLTEDKNNGKFYHDVKKGSSFVATEVKYDHVKPTQEEQYNAIVLQRDKENNTWEKVQYSITLKFDPTEQPHVEYDRKRMHDNIETALHPWLVSQKVMFDYITISYH